MEKPLISIIIPIYNTENHLEKCMESVIAQTFQNMEIILVNDASTDTSGEICNRYARQDKRVTVIHLTENCGASRARNLGIARAAGKFICFVDADDYLEKNMLELLYKSIVESGAEVSICGVHRRGFGPYADAWPEGGQPMIISGEQALSYMLKRQFFSWAPFGKLFSSEIIKRRRFEERVYCGEDILFLYHLFQQVTRVSFLPDKLYHYIYREGSITHGHFSEKQYTEVFVYEYLYKDVTQKYPELTARMEQKILSVNVRLAVRALESPELGTRRLYSYLRTFRKNVRRHFNREALGYFQHRKIAAETILLYISADAFWVVFVLYRMLNRQVKKCG